MNSIANTTPVFIITEIKWAWDLLSLPESTT